MNAADPAIAAARQLLVDELGADPQAIRIVRVEDVAWPNSALGCPKPGMMYMQVITPGYRITLEHGGQHYTVHTDRGRRAVRCDHRGGRGSSLA